MMLTNLHRFSGEWIIIYSELRKMGALQIESKLIFLLMARQLHSGPRPPLRDSSDTPHSVGLLWISDRPEAEIST